MKNILIIGLLLLLAAYLFSTKDTFPKTVSFLDTEYKLSDDTGKKGLAKTYRYTESGNISGLNDYVQIVVIHKVDETDGAHEKMKKMITQRYNLKPAPSTDGEFGVFRVPSEQRDFFAYVIEKETASANWFITYVIQSNFSAKPITPSEAKKRSRRYIASLENVFEKVFQEAK